MRIIAHSVDEYLQNVPSHQRESLMQLRSILRETLLPRGFIEGINYGMISYHVSHETYPKGYHCNPTLPLPFVSIAAQKHGVHFYHMGLYSDQKLLKWFQGEYSALPHRLDMGKSCIRWKNLDTIPYDLIRQLCIQIDAGEWIQRYESSVR